MAKGLQKAHSQLTVQQTLIPLNLHTQFSLECSCQYGWALELEVVNYTNNPLIACRAQMKWTRGSDLQCGKWNGRASPIMYVHVLRVQTTVGIMGDWFPLQSVHTPYLFIIIRRSSSIVSVATKSTQRICDLDTKWWRKNIINRFSIEKYTVGQVCAKIDVLTTTVLYPLGPAAHCVIICHPRLKISIVTELCRYL